MPTPIVTVQVTQQVAPSPSILQQTGAFISQGGTVLAAGSYALLQTFEDLTEILPPTPLPLLNVAWTSAYGGQVTAALDTVTLGIPVGTFFTAIVRGVAPSQYNGAFKAQAISASSFTYFLPGADPGPMVTPGTVDNPPSAELTTMATTFFSQGNSRSVYVLELGPGAPSAGVQALNTFITETDEQFFYSYLVPKSWDADPTFLAFLATFENTTAKTYFFITTTLDTWTSYTAQMKDALTLIEAPAYSGWAANVLTAISWLAGVVTANTTNPHGVKPGDWFNIQGVDQPGYNGWHQATTGTTGSTLIYSLATDPGAASQFGTLLARPGMSTGALPTEFTMAAPFYVSLNYNPGPTNRVPPYAFSFLFGVTPFPTFGNSSLIQTLKNGNINYVGTGAEGGISDLILLWGHTMDGRPFNYWYSVDWMQINVDEAISNAIINGSNTNINPLYYNQDGINRLEDVAASVGAAAISFGLAIGRVIQVGLDPVTFNNNLTNGLYDGNLVVNAVPFATYLRAKPGDYKIGEYDGLTMVYTPARGFEHIVFNIVVTDFVAAGI
jgi:hypothetical protein